MDAFKKTGQTPTEFIHRHVSGDWGDLCDEDKQTNEDALSDGGRIFSTYHLKDDVEFWIITKADRSAT
ncbi:hypothetical protein [Symmachiella dynata]|uniref:hypothetical protein n=1 Tax=Symmachiella dynata TaxID=2527995 RepID=UPI001E3F8FF8|nr:hypothetical protein [Symmachiella dynata]